MVNLVELAGEICLVPVGEVSAVREIHGQDPVTGLEDAEIDRHVRLAAAVGLDIHVIRAEKFLRALDCERFHRVHKFTASIPAATGIALRILVGEAGALRLHHGPAGEILGSDQLDVFELAFVFLRDGFGDLRVGCGECREVIGGFGGCHG